MAIANASGDDTDTKIDKVAIAGNTDAINADFGVNKLNSDHKNIAVGAGAGAGADFNLDFDALKVNVVQVSRGLQFLVQQLEAAFESNDSALTTSSASNLSS